MEGRREVEALRRRLYRPGAGAADLDSYRRVAEEPAAPVVVVAPVRRRRRPAIAAGVLGVALMGVALIGVGLAAGTSAPPAATVALDPATGAVVAVPMPAVDEGSRRFATGRSDAGVEGRYRYTVAPGDTVVGIARRFGICTGDVLVALPYGFDESALPAGQQLVVRRFATSVPRYDAAGNC